MSPVNASRAKNATLVFITTVLILVLPVSLVSLLGIRINTSNSIPIGVYRVSHEPITKGSYVTFCPPQNEIFDEAKARGYINSGRCPGGYIHMMKKLVAEAGDVILIKSEGIYINGTLLPDSAPLPSDGNHRPLPRYPQSTYVLGPDEVLLMGENNPNSFDGRYFGPIKRQQLKEKVTLFFQLR